MKYRYVIIDILIVIIVSTLFILLYNRNAKDSAYSVTATNKNFKIYLITMDKQDQHWYLLNQGASDMAELLGVTYTWTAPERKNTRQQIELLNNAVEAGANAILIAANDPVRLSSAIEDAKAKSVKIIYVDSPAYEEATITLSTDNYHAGTAAAETMIAEFSELGISSGKIGIIGVNSATDSTMRREQGFRDTFDKDGRFKLLPTKYENGDPTASELSASGMIQENSDLVGLFGTNEGSSIGVGNTIKNSSKPIIGIGFDQSQQIINLLKEGYLKDIIVQNPYTMGYLGMAEAIAALNGYNTGPDSIDTGISIISRP